MIKTIWFRYAEIMLSLLAPDCIYLLDTFDYNPDEYPGKKK